MPRGLQIVGYVGWFFVVFAISVYLTFPLDQLKPMAVEFVEVKMLGRDSPVKVGRHGTNPVFTVGKLTPWRVSGGEASRVHVQLASRNADPGPAFDLDEVRVRVGLLSLLSDEVEVSFDADLYQGTASGTLYLVKDDLFGGKASAASLRSIEADLQGVKLDTFGPLVAKLGVPVTGTIDANIDLALGVDPQKDGEGLVDVKVSRITLGPGELKVYGPLTTEIPLIDIGQLDAKLPVEKGKGKTETFSLDGRDGNAKAEAELTLSKRLGSSRLDMNGSFLIAAKFLKDNPKFEGALGFLPGVDKAKDSEGRIHFAVAGPFSGLKPALSKDGGKTKGRKRSRRSRRKK